MKLLYKTTRDYLIASISILIITGVTLFAVLRYEIGAEMNEQLELQADEVFEHARAGNFINAPLISIRKVPSQKELTRVFGDSMLYDRIQREVEEYYYLKQTRDISGGRFQVTVMTSHIGWDRYYLTIFYIFVLMALLLTGSGVLINYFSNKKIWKPFFDNLKNVQQFSVSSPGELQLNASSIHEFQELDRTLKDLTDRSKKEYLALREFTENASHEIQTPLSIIQSKLDRMSQLNVSEELAGYIVQAKSGVERLSKMNRGLLLLAKLDNKVFTDQQLVAIDELLDSQLRNMEDLFTNKQITVHSNLTGTQTNADTYLSETLISNLLSNALRYTPVGGSLHITLANRLLTVSNTGTALSFPAGRIFERFTKDQSNIKANGLGLAIAKEICVMNGWDIGYRFQEGKHHFDVNFSPNQ